MSDDLEYTIFSEETIKERVTQLGTQISSDYAEKTPMLVGILKGSFIFLADLARAISLNCEIRFISASSYGDDSESCGNVKITQTLDFETANKDIILVEDILDSGTTMAAIYRYFHSLEPASIKTCVLLDKPARRKEPFASDYFGFVCPDEFVVGYGLDFAERYRNLPYIAALKPEIYS